MKPVWLSRDIRGDEVASDDRIVWPCVIMGYDNFTRAAYAAKHAGRQPPADARDPA